MMPELIREDQMDISTIAKDFTDMLKRGQHMEAAAKYNADDIVSIEAMDGPMARVTGAEAIRQKGEWWFANHEVHGGEVLGPFVNGDQFVVRFNMDVTVKATGVRSIFDEVGVYTLDNGKIVSERFFYLTE